MLKHTLPKNEAEAAALARAKQLSDFKWTPVRDVPSYTVKDGLVLIPAGIETTGFPYSSTERQDKFFAENVSFETFLSAIPNPYSKLYQAGHGNRHASNYGIVCNSFVRYALGIVPRVNTANWFSVPGMQLIAPAEGYGVEDICLLDILHAHGNGRNHVALITDLLRDETGAIAEVEVSEAVPPLCKRKCYTPEEFFEHFKLFSLCRYEKLDEVPPLDGETDKLLWESGIEKIIPGITVDNGNKSNYLVGEEVTVSVFADAPDTVEVYRNGELVCTETIGGKAVFPLELERGYYVAKLKENGDSVEFCVNQADVSHVVQDGIITIHADPCDEQSRVSHADFRKPGKTKAVAPLVKFEFLTEEEKDRYVFSRPVPEGAAYYKVYYRNAYGVWTHPAKPI